MAVRDLGYSGSVSLHLPHSAFSRLPTVQDFIQDLLHNSYQQIPPQVPPPRLRTRFLQRTPPPLILHPHGAVPELPVRPHHRPPLHSAALSGRNSRHRPLPPHRHGKYPIRQGKLLRVAAERIGNPPPQANRLLLPGAGHRRGRTGAQERQEAAGR